MIGYDATVHAISAYTSAFVAVYADLFFQRIVLQERQKETQAITEAMGGHAKERDRWLEAMKQINVQGGDSDRFKAVLAQFTFASGQWTEQFDALKTSSRAQFAVHLELYRSAIDQFRRIHGLVPSVLFAVRKELELPLDEEQFMKAYLASSRQQAAVLEAFMEKVKRATEEGERSV